MNSRFRLAALLPVVLFLAVAGIFYTAIFSGSDPSKVPSALIGRYVPEFALGPVEGLEQPGLSNADFAQGGPVIVNVWASWCVPCRTEMPLLVELQRVADVPLYGINYKDDPAAARRFLAELGNPFERIGKDDTGRAAIDWGVYGVPETYIVDGKGRIALKHVGPLTPEAIAEEILPALRAARS
ncbi:MAG: DsbE family thiol:disulfide interchange protein [Alphaproteobacteria bacterium]|nr:DsbE family thiol:disulfide interchange protein [Alphaproteobacteria bacterium]MDX5414861.1 DsbE family thiol:disulfide interchange protein [Alphaproteobacteria bacterium]MDX5492034.1 DsbE family thiol:disulfide interchange protein [Alphaproteobacteria bacterium]